MRRLIRNVLTQAEANALMQNPLHGSEYSRVKTEGASTALWGHPVVSRLAELAWNAVGAEVKGDAYCVVEQKGDGSLTPHTDRSVQYREKSGHLATYGEVDAPEMAWCRFSMACLLSPPASFDGGEFYFRDPEMVIQPTDHYLSAALYSSDQIHGVRHKAGDRATLLLFFA